MNMAPLIIWFIAVGVIFLYFLRVGRRIKKYSKMQQYIIDTAFLGDPLNKEWVTKIHFCNRQAFAVEYGFRPITLDLVLSRDEINRLHTVDGYLIAPDPRWLPRQMRREEVWINSISKARQRLENALNQAGVDHLIKP